MKAAERFGTAKTQMALDQLQVFTTFSVRIQMERKQRSYNLPLFTNLGHKLSRILRIADADS